MEKDMEKADEWVPLEDRHDNSLEELKDRKSSLHIIVAESTTRESIDRSPFHSQQATLGSLHSEARKSCLPFNLHWCFGYSVNKPVLNLTTNVHSYIFYVSSNVGILYDYIYKEMRLFQGHINHITSFAVDARGRWIVTADAGRDSAVVVWEAEKCVPVLTLFDPHGDYGSRVVALSHNAKFLVSVGRNKEQTLAFWAWTFGSDLPDAMCQLGKDLGVVKNIAFRPKRNEHFVITAENGVTFITWDGNTLKRHTPSTPPLKQRGHLVESVYLPKTRVAITGTTKGVVIVWTDAESTEAAYSEEGATNAMELKKHLQLEKYPITVLRAVDKVVVTGNAKGRISFYDQTLKLLYWCHKFNLDSVTGINFHLGSRYRTPKSKCVNDEGTSEYSHFASAKGDDIDEQVLSYDATLERNPFIIREFIVCTESGQVGLVNVMRNTCDFILDTSVGIISSMTVHPEKTHLCIGNSHGQLFLWNHRTKECLKSKSFTSDNMNAIIAITALQFAPSGLFLACGLDNGSLWFLDTSVLAPLQESCQQHSTSKITQIIFSEDSKYLAHKDSQMYVYVYYCYEENGSAVALLGKSCSHYKPIRDILFVSDSSDSKELRLFSLGEDRNLVEYDISNSKSGTLQVLSTNRIEQTAIPLSLMMYPDFTEDSLIMIANDEHKYKLLSDKTKMCHRTVLGPTCGSPVCSIQILPSTKPQAQKIYALILTEKHIGIQILPVDGNPYKSLMMLAHPEEVVHKYITTDGTYLFTVGKNDCCIYMWQVNKRAVDAMVHVGGEDLMPFYSLLEGGKAGWLMRQMEDFFYYAQLLHQGDKLPILHKISDHIPLCELPNFMRAIGYYPTEYEIENMLHEVKYAESGAVGKNVDKIKFCDLLKLYLNHRPAKGVPAEKLKAAFFTFARRSDDNIPVIKTSELLKVLQERGEGLSVIEIHDYLRVLLHQRCPSMTELSHSDISVQETTPQTTDTAVAEIPEDLSYNQLAEDILGVPGTVTENLLH